MDANNYVGITEFAAMAKVSRQTIYNKLDTDLQPYVKTVNDRKTINLKGLEVFNVKPIDTDSQKVLQDMLTILQKQIDVKDAQILTLEAQMTVKDGQVEQLNQRLKEALKLNSNNQVLLLGKQGPPTQPQLPTPEKKKPFWKFWG